MKINEKGLDINKTKPNSNSHQEEKDSKHLDHNSEKDHKPVNNFNKNEKRESAGVKIERTTDENLRKGCN